MICVLLFKRWKQWRLYVAPSKLTWNYTRFISSKWCIALVSLSCSMTSRRTHRIGQGNAYQWLQPDQYHIPLSLNHCGVERFPYLLPASLKVSTLQGQPLALTHSRMEIYPLELQHRKYYCSKDSQLTSHIGWWINAHLQMHTYKCDDPMGIHSLSTWINAHC